jgi:hypothetical protein
LGTTSESSCNKEGKWHKHFMHNLHQAQIFWGVRGGGGGGGGGWRMFCTSIGKSPSNGLYVG